MQISVLWLVYATEQFGMFSHGEEKKVFFSTLLIVIAVHSAGNKLGVTRVK